MPRVSIKSAERLAQIGNGLIVLISTGLTAFPATTRAGFWLLILMSGGLIMTGLTGYCGWRRLLAGRGRPR